MTSRTTIETKCGVFLEIDEYNELRKADPYRRLIDEGFVDVQLICYSQEVRLTVSNQTTVQQLIDAAKVLMKVPDFGTKTLLRHEDGYLLESVRRLEEMDLKYGVKLFIS